MFCDQRIFHICLVLSLMSGAPMMASTEARAESQPSAKASGAGQTHYVPEPRPVTSDYLVGVHYFSGWKQGTHFGWQKVEPHPERKPLLGYYDEGDPEVADWEIKWALEHGINYFVYCWYRRGFGKPVNDETLYLVLSTTALRNPRSAGFSAATGVGGGVASLVVQNTRMN